MPPKEVGHAKEASELVYVCGRRHLNDCFDLVLIWVDSMFVDSESQECDFVFTKFTFVLLELDVRISESVQRTGQITVMVLVVLAVEIPLKWPKIVEKS